MAVTYTTTLKNDRLNLVDDAVNAGAAAGKLEIGTTGMASVLATFTLSDPAFGAASGGVLTLSGTPLTDSSADATGTAAEARFRDSDNNDVVTGLTVGTSGTDITLNTVSIVAGQEVTLNSGTITHG